jgi:hypothetical protein
VTTKDQLEEARKQTAEFQRDVRDAVQRIETRRREQLRCARGGGVFEDAVAEFVHRVVVEAKRDKSYSLSKCLEEIAIARKNRDAGAGIFVLARSHAMAALPTFARFGQDIIVIWDDENKVERLNPIEVDVQTVDRPWMLEAGE